MSARSRRLLSSILACTAMLLVIAAAPVAAQVLQTPTTTVDQTPFDRPFSRGYYLIHLLGTNTMNGFVEKDSYILWATPPENGWFLTPDGMGGTFNNKGTSLGGPFTTPRQVCDAAKGLPATKQSFGVEDRYWDCRQLASGGGDDAGGGIGTVGLVAALAAGAAAATGLALTWNRIRNRERPSWTRPGPDEGLSPECVAALTQLRRGVDDVLGRLSDLQLARDGALRQAIAANAQAEFLDALSQRPGSTASTVAEGAGVVNTTSDVIGLGGSVLEGSDLAGVPAWVEEARRTLATADDMADAASALERQLARDLLLGRSTLIDPRVVAAYATQAKTGWTRGATAAATAAQRSTILKHLGTGLGVVSALAGVTGWVFGARHFDDLEQMGRWRGRAELRRAEADRWMGLAGEVSTRVADLEREFDTAIAAYNERARVCNAVPLTPPTWAQITEEFSRNALPVGADAPPSTAIETVLPTGPQPVPTDDRAGGCDRSVYDRLLQQYQQSLARRDDAATRHRTWAEHAADAKVAATAVEADRDRLRAYISESQNWWRGLNVAGLGATALPVLFTFSPPAAIVCGVVSIGTSLVSGAAVPNDMLVEMGRIDTIAQQLPVFVEQFRLERDRARRALDEADENARQRHFQLVMMHGRCSATTGAGWPESPPHPSLTVPIVTDGRPRPYVEIIRWH